MGVRGWRREVGIVLAALTLALTGLGLSRVYAAVDLSWFKATPQDDHILLEWETATELNTSGFYVLRSTNINGPFNPGSRINPILIRAKSLDDGGFLLPHQYEHRDWTALPGVTYFYVLEEIDLSGHSHLYLQNKDAAVFGVPSPTATTTPTVPPTPVASGTPTQTPEPAVTPARSTTPTATPPPPTHTPLVLGGERADASPDASARDKSQTPPPPPPADTSPTAQPTEASQPAPPAPTQVKPTQQPTHSQVTAVQTAMAGQPETVEAPTMGAELVLATPTGAEPATAVVPPPGASSATAPPRLTKIIPAQTQEQPPAPPREAGEPTSPIATSGALSLAWKLGVAVVAGGLALALLHLLRPPV